MKRSASRIEPCTYRLGAPLCAPLANETMFKMLSTTSMAVNHAPGSRSKRIPAENAVTNTYAFDNR